MNDFVKLYVALIAKEIFKEINSYEKQYSRALKTEIENKANANSVRSQRHWKASATVDLCIKQLDQLYGRLVELDRQANWSSYLHQERFKFIEKYPKVIKKYMDVYEFKPVHV